jgi:hypothetical protein
MTSNSPDLLPYIPHDANITYLGDRRLSIVSPRFVGIRLRKLIHALCLNAFAETPNRAFSSALQRRSPVEHNGERAFAVDRLAENELVAILGDAVHDGAHVHRERDLK